MTQPEWDEVLAASDALRRGNLRPLVLEDHGRLSRLWTEVAPPRIEPQRLTLLLEVGASGVSARLDDGGEPWEPKNLFDDDDFIAAVDELRELGSRSLPTDDHGVLAPAAAGVAALLRERAAAVGERLSSALLSEEARTRLRAAVHAGSAGSPALLQLRVALTDANAELVQRADRWLALPWELLRIDGRFPVEDHTLDLVREAVVEELPGLDEPERPLSIVATAAAPVDGVELDHEGEMYRLWRALGSGDEARLKVTDLGTLKELVAAVEKYHPPVVHFIGHGRPGELIFEDDAACSRAGCCTVLSAPAPWEAIRELEPVEGTGRTLVDAGLLSPFQAAGGPWWAPHRLVCETVIGLWEGDAGAAHQQIGRWFQAEFEENRGSMLLAQRAVEHLCAAGDGDVAWPTAEALVLWLRRAGRYREALAWVERMLDAKPSGSRRGMALKYDVELRRNAGSLSAEGENKLQEALALVGKEERGPVLAELGAFFLALGRLSEASAYLGRAVEALIEAQGEEHPEVATSLHALAGVLHAQGDLGGAREKLERVLEIRAKVHGTREHYLTAITEANLGVLLQKLGKAESGASLLAHAHRVFLRQLGPDHPYTRRLAPLVPQEGELGE